MSVSLRSVFTSGNVDVRQEAVSRGLSAPISVRSLAANASISARYQALGGYKGRLGVATGPITSSGDGINYFQTYRGGTLRTTSGAPVQLDDGVALKLIYKGIHCFGNPGFGKSDTVYGIISWLTPEQGKTNTVKVPEDNTDDAYDNLEQGEDRTQGATEIIDLQILTPPQPFFLTTNVYRCANVGCSSGSSKTAVADAFGSAAGAFGNAVGGPVGAGILTAIGNWLGNALGGLIFGDNPMNPVTKTFSIDDLFALPAPSSITFGAMQFNFETDIITDGDASYKMYFDVMPKVIAPPPP